MKNKIKELYIKTIQTKRPDKTWAYDFDEYYAEVFADFILEECIKLCLDQRNPQNLNYKPSEKFAEAIRLHFGLNRIIGETDE